MSSRPTDSGPGVKLFSLLMFLGASILSGLLVAGLAVPVVAVAAGSTKSAADGLNDLPQDLAAPPQPEASKVLLADGSLLAQFYDQNRSYVSLDQVSPMMQKAQLAIEDHRFYSHGAIDLLGMMRAAVGNAAGANTSGGSTLTQQYVKLVRIQIAQDSNDKEGVKAAQAQTVSRKITEMRYAIAMEKKLSKAQVLERYLNIAYYGDQTYGVQAAARHYFGVDAKDLDLEQSALLAGLVQSPSTTDPVHYPDAALVRRNVVLNRIAQLDKEDPSWFTKAPVVTAEQVAASKAIPFDKSKVTSQRVGCVGSRYPFICDYVWRTLVSDQMPGLGNNADERGDTINRAGLTIQTVIDPGDQDAAQGVLSGMVDPKDPVVSGAVLLEPKSGLITAMVQSRPVMGKDAAAGETYYNLNAPYDMGGNEGYQPGSTFKAFTLAAALAQGVPFNKTYAAPKSMDFSRQIFQSCSGGIPADKNWGVKNFAGEDFPGGINLVKATEDSVNTYFVQLEKEYGICASVQMAMAAGVTASLPGTNGVIDKEHGTTDLIKGWASDQYASFVLGTREVTPLIMASAFGTFANNGIHCDPIMLKSVKNKQGTGIPVPSANCRQTIDPNVAAGVSTLLSNVVSRGSGTLANIPGYDLAGKTGTVDGASAVWFTGYSPELAASTFIAVDRTQTDFWAARGRSPANASVANLRLPYSDTFLSGTGGRDATRVWKALMAEALKDYPNTTFPAYSGSTSTAQANPSGTAAAKATARFSKQPSAPAIVTIPGVPPATQPAATTKPGKGNPTQKPA